MDQSNHTSTADPTAVQQARHAYLPGADGTYCSHLIAPGVTCGRTRGWMGHTSTEPQRVGDIPAARLLRVIADRIDQGLTKPRDIFFSGRGGAELSWHNVPDNDLAVVQPWIDLFRCEPRTTLSHGTNRWSQWSGYWVHYANGISVTLVAHHPDAPEGGEPR